MNESQIKFTPEELKDIIDPKNAAPKNTEDPVFNNKDDKLQTERKTIQPPKVTPPITSSTSGKTSRREVIIWLSAIVGSGVFVVGTLEHLQRQSDAKSILQKSNTSSSPTPIIKQDQIQKKAKEILRDDFIGADEIERAFGQRPEDQRIPPLPANEDWLLRARANSELLILRISPTNSKTNPGSIQERLGMKPQSLSFSSPLLGWALVSKNLIPESVGRDYKSQTDLIEKYLKEVIFKDKPIPLSYVKAFEEFADCVRKYESGEYKKKDPIIPVPDQARLIGLSINKMTRQTEVTAIYDQYVYFKNTNKKLYENNSIWTNVFGGPLVVDSNFNVYDNILKMSLNEYPIMPFRSPPPGVALVRSVKEGEV